MSKKIRIHARVVYDWTYEADSEHYGTDNPVEMVKMDERNCLISPVEFIEGERPEVNFEVVE
jgi:hypothetical protein